MAWAAAHTQCALVRRARKHEVEHRRVDWHQCAKSFVYHDVHAVALTGTPTQQAPEVEVLPLGGMRGAYLKRTTGFAAVDEGH